MQHNNNPFTHQQKSHSEIAISHENFTIEFLEISQDVIKKIKSFIETKKIDKPYWEINNYNPKIIEASKMCDILLEYDTITIEILENLSDNYKRCVADMFLGVTSLELLHQIGGDGLILWIYCNAYPYGNKHNDVLPEYIMQHIPIIGSEQKFNLFEKSCNSFWRLHFKNKNYTAIIHMYKMQLLLSNFLGKKNIVDLMGEGFGLQPLYSRGDAVLGREKSWGYKELDTSGNIFSEKIGYNVSHYVDSVGDVINRSSAYLSVNFSGKRYLVYLDGPIGISITHNGQPIAMIVFSLYDNKTLFIHQMQAVTVEHYDRYGRITKKAVDPIVPTIQWQEKLYTIMQLYAKEMGLNYIMIQSAQNNRWVKEHQTVIDYDDFRQEKCEVDTGETHFSLENAQKLYDTFARNHGFEYQENTHNFIKKIDTDDV